MLDPDHLAHRFYQREGPLLVEFAAGQQIIGAQTVAGFWLKRSWLDPEKLPPVRECLEEIGAVASQTT